MGWSWDSSPIIMASNDCLRSRYTANERFLTLAAIMTYEVCSLRVSATAAESVIDIDEVERKHRSYVVCDDEGGRIGLVAVTADSELCKAEP